MLGISIATKALFGINIPVAKTFVAIFFVYTGLTILLGPPFFRSSIKISRVSDNNDHVIVFSNQTIDLTELSAESDQEIETVVVFGNGTIRINPNTPTKIIFKGAFASITLPDNHEGNSLMGKTMYITSNFEKNKKHLLVEVTAVFANVRVVTV